MFNIRNVDAVFRISYLDMDVYRYFRVPINNKIGAYRNSVYKYVCVADIIMAGAPFTNMDYFHPGKDT